MAIPNAVDDSFTLSENDSLDAMDLRANDTLDSDPEASNALTLDAPENYLFDGPAGLLLTADDISVSLDVNHLFSFTPGVAFQALGAGESVTVQVRYFLHGDQPEDLSSAWVTLTVEGENDAPVFSDPTPVELYDSVALDSYAPVNGSLSASDAESDTLTYHLTGDGVVDNGDGTESLTGVYGTLRLDRASGAYTFTPDAAAVNAAPGDVQESFGVSASDGVNVMASTLQVNVDVEGFKLFGTEVPNILSLSLEEDYGVEKPYRFDLDGGMDLVMLSGTAQVRFSLTAGEVGNGSANDSGLLPGQDGGLAVRVVVEDESGSPIGPVSRMDDEGTIFLSLGNDFEVRELGTDVPMGGVYGAVALGTAASDDFLAAADYEVPLFILAGQGDDLMAGGQGNDLFDGGDGFDSVSFELAASAVTANLLTASAYAVNGTIGTDILRNIERLSGSGFADRFTGDDADNRLEGMAGKDSLYGGGGHDVLDGGSDADYLSGGLGNDTYHVDHVSDKVVESSGQGTDTVYSSLSQTLAANVERLWLEGTADVNGLGNSLSNILTGNSGVNALTGLGGNDTLVGGAGADVMTGGTGNDTYEVDDAGDVVVELSGEGTDTVISSVDYSLGLSVERLTLTGEGNISATGNAQANLLIGNQGDNRLEGDAGNDTLQGGAGDDLYVVGRYDGADVVTDTGGEDRLHYMPEVAHHQLWFSRSGQDLRIDLLGGVDRVTLKDWYTDPANRIETIQAGDGKVLTADNIDLLVSVMSLLKTPAAGQESLLPLQHLLLSPFLAASWE